MAINILPANADDAPDLVRVGMLAFADEPLNKHTFDMQNAPPEQVEEFLQWRRGISKLRMGLPGSYFYKAQDQESGAIVGYVGLNGPAVEALPRSVITRPAFVNCDVDDEAERKQAATKKKYLGDRKDVWYVQTMLVHPDFQGRGIAKKLLTHAMKGADRAGQDIYLEGTAAGLPLYLRCDFEPLTDISLLDGKIIFKAMIRHPKPLEEDE